MFCKRLFVACIAGINTGNENKCRKNPRIGGSVLVCFGGLSPLTPMVPMPMIKINLVAFL